MATLYSTNLLQIYCSVAKLYLTLCDPMDYSMPESSVLHYLLEFALGLVGLISLQSKGLFKSLLWHHNSKASTLRCSAFFMVQLSHPYKTAGKTITLTRWTFVGKVMSLLLNMLSRFVIAFLPRSKRLLISLQI